MIDDGAIEREALARNERYLREFVEEHDVCPFARRCRELGALERRIVRGAELEPEAALVPLRELAGGAFAHVEVALLIFPDVRAPFAAFEHFAARVREARAREESSPTYYLVPFHPDSPPDADDPNRLVSLLRRSPDPTLQLVRASLLERLRGRNSEDTVWLDPSSVDLERPPPEPSPSLSTRIARANFDTASRVGVTHLLALLESMRGR